MLGSDPLALLTTRFHGTSVLTAVGGSGLPSSFGSAWEAPVGAGLPLGWLLSSVGGAESSASEQVGSTGVAGKRKRVIMGRLHTFAVLECIYYEYEGSLCIRLMSIQSLL